MKKSKKTNVILSETKNLMRSFTFVQDDVSFFLPSDRLLSTAYFFSCRSFRSFFICFNCARRSPSAFSLP